MAAHLEVRPAKRSRTPLISRQESLLQLLLCLSYPAHNVLYRFRHVVLCDPVQNIRRVGPKGFLQVRNLGCKRGWDTGDKINCTYSMLGDVQFFCGT